MPVRLSAPPPVPAVSLKTLVWRRTVLDTFAKYGVTVDAKEFCRGTATIHKEQLEAACEAFTVFKTREQLYAVLIGQMQSGKTGAFHALIRLMFLSGLIEHAYLLCGSNETVLYNQARGDSKRYNNAYYTSGRLVVRFRQDFDKLTMKTSNALIVIDESHIDQTRNLLLDKMLQRHNIVLSGTNRVMEANNTYIASVSATPFSEYSDVVYNVGHMDTEGAKKAIIRIKPGQGYRGVKYFLDNGLVRSTSDFNLQRDIAAFFNMLRECGNKYALMRLQTKKKSSDVKTLIQTRAPSYGIKVLNFMSGKEEIKLDALENAPTQPTIVLLAGRLRCGKVVPKAHISCVWEGAMSAKTDTILQSLLGRMCGYYEDTPLEQMPVVFLPHTTLVKRKYIRDATSEPIKINELERYVLGFELDSLDKGNIMPTMFMNAACEGSRVSSSHSRTPALPLRYSPESLFNAADLPEFYRRNTRLTKQRLFNFLEAAVSEPESDVLKQIKDDFASSPNYTDAQKAEVATFLSQPAIRGCDIAPRWVDEQSKKSQQTWCQNLHRSIEVGRMLTIHALEGKNEDGSPHRPVLGLIYDKETDKVFVQFQLENESATPLAKRVTRTTGLEIFAKTMVDSEAEPLRGDGSIQSDLPLAVRTDPAAWEAALDELVARYVRSSAGGPIHDYNTISGPLVFSRAAYGWTGHFALPGKRLNIPSSMKDIHTRIGEKYNVEIKVAYNEETVSATRLSTEYFYAASVVWIKK